jgi:hypothetical protein
MFEATPGEISGVGPQSISPQVADSLAARLLGGSRTRMGGLSISHARRVAARVRAKGELVFAVALLHDVIEKGRTTAEDLLVATGDARLVELVVILTRDEWESEEEYLSRCAADPIALQVKRADLEDKLVADGSNLSPTLELRLRRQAGRPTRAAGRAGPPNESLRFWVPDRCNSVITIRSISKLCPSGLRPSCG